MPLLAVRVPDWLDGRWGHQIGMLSRRGRSGGFFGVEWLWKLPQFGSWSPGPAPRSLLRGYRMRILKRAGSVVPKPITRPGVVVSRELPDREWDAFIEATPGGSHQQSSMWAQVKAVQGFQAARILLRRDGGIVGGCQILLRRLGKVGAVAYVPRGPVMADRDPDALDVVLAALDDLAAQERILLLKLQPPADRQDLALLLEARGFVRSRVETAPVASVRVDLHRPAEELLAAMHPSTRKNIRRAERRGVRVRHGGEADIRTLVRIIESTGDRQQFSAYPRRYYEQMWRTFAARGHTCLLIAEHDGIALSASLLIAYGESASYKAGGWSGDGSRLFPNELMHWAGMRWAQQRGLHYYDFEGLNEAVARASLAGEALPEDTPEQRVSHFKLGFGGEVTLGPGSYDRVYPSLLSGALRQLLPMLNRSEASRKVANRMLRRGVPRPSRTPSRTRSDP